MRSVLFGISAKLLFGLPPPLRCWPATADHVHVDQHTRVVARCVVLCYHTRTSLLLAMSSSCSLLSTSIRLYTLL